MKFVKRSRELGLILGFLFAGCADTNIANNPLPPPAPKAKVTTLYIEASRDHAVRTRGGYKVYIGTTSGFSIGSSVKVYNLSGTTESGGRVSQVISGLSAGKYYLKTQTYTDLVNPTLGTAAVSMLSAEVSFNVQ